VSPACLHPDFTRQESHVSPSTAQREFPSVHTSKFALDNFCRKALKLGKFLADVDKLRKLSTHSHMWVAQLFAAGGEVIYLFLEQVTW
jgi:Peroxisomal biogenesis factor 11 (PEX11)